MDIVSIIVGTGWTLAALVIITLAIPLVRGRISPNGFYGVRLPESFQSDDAWYSINRFGGKRLILWSVPLLLVGIACFFLPLQANTGLTLTLGFVPLIFVLIPAFESWRYARKFRPQ